ncbi:GntR family transcriptional regulator [Amycolatopsis alkalitolerans]|uniref:GntR family transcriptional regulator n=1 Tax=Amycolatopsis alkalitolerans TaxID=2547244 RepID=A0A5C4M5Z3_9PSEU|nr:GntR family transcriptional regulator [Amycolatopsis alkalitolerans]TNC26952.1 GntR family transcriptional regulator [Amycolatopsis alkalitolerans]
MSTVRVVVDASSGLAPWRQVQDQIIRLISRGALAPGTRLPPIRQLAGDLGLASGTIARAYRELEAAGWVRTARARGTVVAETAERSDPAALLRAAAAEFVSAAKEIGADEETAVSVVRKAYGSP